MRIITVVAWYDAVLPRVRDVKHSPASPAAKHAGEQRAAAAARLDVSFGFHVRIGSQHRLIAFILLPANVTGMVIGNQDGPRGSRFQMSLALPRPTLHDLGAHFPSAEGVGARVDGIRENRPDIAINGQFPHDRGFARIARQHRYANVLLAKPEQRLANAAQLDHLVKDQQDGLLYALVGILFNLAAGE